jgi:hypothetical protein
MWGNVLEWVKALGAGSIIGVFVGAQLTRRSQDRQFARQQVAQRVENARKSYTECLKLAAKINEKVILTVNQAVGDKVTPEFINEIERLRDQLADTEVELHSYGASVVADVFSEIRWSLMGLVITSRIGTPDGTSKEDRWRLISDGIHNEVEHVWTVWDEWASSQLAVEPGWWQVRQRRKSKTTTEMPPADALSR